MCRAFVNETGKGSVLIWEAEMNQFENIYYSREYEKKREEYLGMFDERDFTEAENSFLDRGYSLEIRHYNKCDTTPEGWERHRSCLRSILSNDDGREIFTFETADFDDIFGTSMIFTVKGKEYLFFKEELYGYSVLEICSGQVMHYIPAVEMGESFIIVQSLFCSDISAALCHGCIWAAPYSVCLCDLSDPMSEPAGYLMLEDIIDLSGELQSGGDYFEDISLKEIKGGRYIFSVERYIDKTGETVKEEYAFTGNFLRRKLDALK